MTNDLDLVERGTVCIVTQTKVLRNGTVISNFVGTYTDEETARARIKELSEAYGDYDGLISYTNDVIWGPEQ